MKSYFTALTGDNAQKLDSFYAVNAGITLPGGKIVEGTVSAAYLEIGFLNSAIDLGKGSVKAIPLIADSIFIEVSGELKREIKGKEIVCDFVQNFLLVPDKQAGKISYFIARETLKFGKEVTIEPAPKFVPPVVEEKKPSPKVDKKKPVLPAAKQEPVPEVVVVPEPQKPFSYASAAALPSAPTATAPVARATRPVQKPQSAEAEKKSDAPSNPDNILLVRRVPVEASEEDLKNLFSASGAVVSVTLKKDDKVAYIEFDSVDVVKSLLEVDVKDRKATLKLGGKDYVLDLWSFRNYSQPKPRPAQKTRA